VLGYRHALLELGRDSAHSAAGNNCALKMLHAIRKLQPSVLRFLEYGHGWRGEVRISERSDRKNVKVRSGVSFPIVVEDYWKVTGSRTSDTSRRQPRRRCGTPRNPMAPFQPGASCGPRPALRSVRSGIHSTDPFAAQGPKVRRLFAGGRWIRTCMGLFLSSRRFWLLSVLCSERGGRSSSRRLRSGFAERAEGVKGPKR